jgi:hypothetical protein
MWGPVALQPQREKLDKKSKEVASYWVLSGRHQYFMNTVPVDEWGYD